MAGESEGGGAAEHGKVLDLLIVGGGPAGTAAAFRARELELDVLVIDFDDLMKRIRDYSKDKLILPNFGGGDRMAFPAGGELIAALCFEPIDKDDMCHCWKGLYVEHGIPARTGIELTALEERDGVLAATGWDHAGRADVELLARHVLLCLGRGVPRRFDIPGNTDGIGFRLGDPALHVGQPACVLGGGTSAAEAVIAISNAKTEAGDASAIYWSYRGDRMPRISKALAEVFFEAYVGNGNIRYCPLSEPAAIVTGEDRTEYLSIRVDRRRMADRPSETTHLEFPKEHCIACIGEDIPEGLLGSCGIEMVFGGPKKKKRMVVNRYLESRQPNVYLAGDILSQAYFETDDFAADPAGFREIKHRGNIKSALRDGVVVAEVVRQRLDGKTEIELPEVVEPEVSAPAVAAVLLQVEGAGPPDASLAPERSAPAAEAFLTRRLPTGVEEDEYPIAPRSVTTIGRKGCDINLPEDTLLIDRHASISHTEDGYFLRDDGSSTGVFLRLPVARQHRLEHGDLVRLGRQFLRFTTADGQAVVTHFDHTGREVGRHELGPGTIVLGRNAPGVTLDAEDLTLSRRQLAVTLRDGELFAKDLKSVNGTYVRVRNAQRLEDGDQFRLGQQTFVFSLGAASAPPAASAPMPQVDAAAPAEAPAEAPAAETSAAAATGPVTVKFKGAAEAIVVKPGQTLCEAAEEGGVEITAECHSGICGSDPIRILSGRDNLDGEPAELERETLEDICEVEPGECRLACMVRASGPVEVEIL